MKLTRIRNLGRFRQISTGKEVNVKVGQKVGVNTSHLFYLHRGTRVLIQDFDFYTTKPDWEQIN